MRILQVIHQFPPHSSQGSEVYCFNLARELRGTEDVRVFHISNTTRKWQRRLMRGSHAELPIYHCVDWGEYTRLADWPNPFLRTSFRTVLDEFRPEVVHFHNYLSLGDDLVSLARRSGAAIVYTLHDFGLICPNALLLRDDGTLCTKDEPDFFAHCCPFLIRTSGHERGAMPWFARVPALARWHLFAKQHPRAAVGAVLRVGTWLADRLLGAPRVTHSDRKRDFFFTHTRQIFRDADLFLAPSGFLLQRFVSCGIPRDKIEHLPYGMRHFPRAERRHPGGSVRFGYIGALHPHKGIELLLEAFRGLRGSAGLHVYGSAFGSPISNSYWARVRDDAGGAVTFHGAYENSEVARILGELDAVIVPSRWYENAPLTIQEAFIAGVPVITADVGGMAELVHDGIDGIHFRFGDASDLRRRLQEIVDQPAMLERLRAGIPPVCEMREHGDAVRAHYRRVVAQHGTAQPGPGN